MTILDEIAEKTRQRVAEEQRQVPLSQVRRAAEDRRDEEKHRTEEKRRAGENGPETKSCRTRGDGSAVPAPSTVLPFEAALRAPGMSFICEVKKASPSKIGRAHV